MKRKASFLPKPGVFTLQSAASHQSCFTKDDFHSLSGLERQSIRAPAPFSGAGLWFVPSSMKAIRAIRRKRSSGRGYR